MIDVENKQYGIKVYIDQHEEMEDVDIDKPFPQTVTKVWTVIDEQVTLDEVVEAIANSIDFIDFYGNAYWGADEFWFVALISGEPHMFCITTSDIRMLNTNGRLSLLYLPDSEWKEDAQTILDNYLKED